MSPKQNKLVHINDFLLKNQEKNLAHRLYLINILIENDSQ
jgi:hypothetical protein